MCRRDTVAHWLVIAMTCGALAPGGLAQTAGADIHWRQIAGTSVSEGLAGPAGGPVAAVWYSGTGALLARTASGRIFETSDFVHWHLNTNAGISQPAARIQASGSHIYAAASDNIYASGDNGSTWLNMTAFNGRSVIGNGFNALAVAPSNQNDVTAANQFGIWRSLDGGLSWQSLNESLPNLLARKLIDRRTVLLADGTLAHAKSANWTLVDGADPELALRTRLSARAQVSATAAAQAGSFSYAGTSDGRLLISRDNGATWNETTATGGGYIQRIWIASERPEAALAISGARLLRTVNGGVFWDDVTGALPQTGIHGIAADVSAGVVYLATDRGVFSGSLSLNDAGPSASNWSSISTDLPAAAAWDVRLNPDNTLTVALDGYGVFETQAPHRARGVRIVNGADLSDRPGAPGSLISVLGAKVLSAKIQQPQGDGPSYPVLAASDQSSQLQVPFEAAAGTFSLALEGAGNRWTVPLTLKETAPAIFIDSEGSPLILDSASGLVVDPTAAIHAGSVIQILATGLGKVTPDWPTGVPAPVDSPPAVIGMVSAFLDGTPVEVTRAALAPGYVGYYTVELKIPAIVNRGASELRLVMNGQESNRVKLYLEPDPVPNQ